jgi:hypothetical protein
MYSWNNTNNSLQKRAKANSTQEREKGRASRHRGASGRRGRRKEGNRLGRSRRLSKRGSIVLEILILLFSDESPDGCNKES